MEPAAAPHVSGQKHQYLLKGVKVNQLLIVKPNLS